MSIIYQMHNLDNMCMCAEPSEYIKQHSIGGYWWKFLVDFVIGEMLAKDRRFSVAERERESDAVERLEFGHKSVTSSDRYKKWYICVVMWNNLHKSDSVGIIFSLVWTSLGCVDVCVFHLEKCSCFSLYWLFDFNVNWLAYCENILQDL